MEIRNEKVLLSQAHTARTRQKQAKKMRAESKNYNTKRIFHIEKSKELSALQRIYLPEILFNFSDFY